jgi:diaminopimelate epimerase
MDDMLEFAKYQAAGNDFIIIEDMDGRLDLKPEHVRRLCDRHYGIGSDGLIVARKSDKADAYMLFFNPDGSLAEMCGNGIRCFARFLYERELVEKKKMLIETKAGLKEVELFLDIGNPIGARVNMGPVSFLAKDIPTTLVEPDKEVVEVPLVVNGITLTVTCVSVGNPHCVIFIDDYESVDLRKIGPLIENHPAFPQRTNVELATIVEPHMIRAKVWERGAGATLACGTGAVAIAAAACKTGYCHQPIRIDLPGGHLFVEFDSEKNAYLEGVAEHVFNGFMSIEFTENYLKNI